MAFAKGDRVKLSHQGKSLHPKNHARLGVVQRDTADGNLVPVRWDGINTTYTYHPDFIELQTANDIAERR